MPVYATLQVAVFGRSVPVCYIYGWPSSPAGILAMRAQYFSMSISLARTDKEGFMLEGELGGKEGTIQ